MRNVVMIMLCLVAGSLWSQQWKIVYPVAEGVILTGGCCNGTGNYVLGACNKMIDNGYSGALAMYVDDNGGCLERRIEYADTKACLFGGISLDNGDLFAVGVRGGSLDNHVFDTLWMVIMTQELEIVEEHFYEIAEPYVTWTGEVYPSFDNDGNVMVLAGASRFMIPYQMTNGVYVVLKCDTHGNALNSRYFTEGHAPNGARPTGIVRVPGTDLMMMMGKGFNLYGNHTLTFIDGNLELAGTYSLPWLEDNWNHTDCWKNNGHFLMSSLTHHHNVLENQFYAAVFEVDCTGEYIDTLVYDRADTSDYTAQYGSMAYFSDETIYVATYWENGSNPRPNDAVICLIDNELNLLGIKKLQFDDTKMRLLHCQITGDGGCLVYGMAKTVYGDEMVVITKLLPEDFVIPWTLTDEPEVASPGCVYPNPTENTLNISLRQIDSPRCKVSVSDLNGRKYFERKFENSKGLLTIDVSLLSNGTYVLEVAEGDVCTLKEKFIKR